VVGLQAAIELLSVKVGQVLMVLGGMHFFNMHMLHKLGRRRPWVKDDRLAPPGLGHTVLRARMKQRPKASLRRPASSKPRSSVSRARL